MMERTLHAYGLPTVLLNSAARTSFGTLAESPAQELDRVSRQRRAVGFAHVQSFRGCGRRVAAPS